MFLIRPGAQRLRGRVSLSMSQALGRSVEIGWVRLHFLPRLGFDLSNVVIHDDPSFGTEPLLRAPEVTAWLSIGALLRGKLAIASLTLSDASLNLTRNAQGKWNLQDLVERTSRSSLAPTGSGRQQGRAAFPYIEAARARINFKSGMEKIHFALADAEFGLWQDSENTWGARLKATPIRTDANLTDTGVIKVDGLWHRAAEAHQIPLQFSFQWKQAQIGQLSTLVYGQDKSWRGNLAISGSVVGRPEHLKITADATIDGFRRQDIFGYGDLRLAAHCAAEYGSPAHTLANLDCTAPAGGGVIEVKGSATPGTSASVPLAAYDLWLVADSIPANSILNTMRHAQPNLADEVSAAGEVSATLQFHKAESQPVLFDGHGTADTLQLSSGAGEAVTFGTVPFALVQKPSQPFLQAASARSTRRAKAKLPVDEKSANQPRVEFGPVTLSAAKASPLQARAALSRAGYEASVRGEAGVKRLLQLSHVLGIPSPAIAADGLAVVDLTIAGAWNDERPLVRGQAQLRSVKAQLRGLNAPVEITTADLAMDPGEVRVQNLVASTGNVTWRGALQIARPCHTPAACPFQFSLHAPELSAAELNHLLNPALAEKAWYSFLSLGSGQPPFLLQAHANGNVTIDKLKLGAASCTHFAADLRLHSGELTLSNIHGEILGGNATGEWSADFSSKPPTYRGKGSLKTVSLSQVAALMHDGWIDGTGSADYDLSAHGSKLPDVIASAKANLDFNLAPGIFSHVVLPTASAPLRAEMFSGNVQLEDGQFTFNDAKLKSAGSVYKLSGTASLKGALSLKITGGAGYNVTGTLLKTRVTAIPVAQAALKR